MFTGANELTPWGLSESIQFWNAVTFIIFRVSFRVIPEGSIKAVWFLEGLNPCHAAESILLFIYLYLFIY